MNILHEMKYNYTDILYIIILGGTVPPSPENPYPISEQNLWFSNPILDLTLKIIYLKISDPVRYCSTTVLQ